MRKTYASSTIASTQKTMPPANIRDRVVRLTETVNELKANVEIEERHKDVVDKINAQNYNTLNSQIKALKKAFNTLADVVMEELDSFKTDVFKDFQESNDAVYKRVDEMASQLFKAQSERQEYKTHILSLDQELRERCRNIEKRTEEDFQILQSIVETSKEDNKVLFEKLKILANNNTAQLELISKDNEKLHLELESLANKSVSETSAYKSLQKRIVELEEKILKTSDQNNALKQSNKADMQTIIRGQTDLNRKIEDTTIKLLDKVESTKGIYEQRFTEVERSLGRLQMEFQENIEELAKIHKDSSTQLILDFEKAITALNSDTKVIFKKFGSVEENLIKTRDELSSMISEDHHVFSRKNEHFEKAFYEICRKLNISNPLLGH